MRPLLLARLVIRNADQIAKSAETDFGQMLPTGLAHSIQDRHVWAAWPLGGVISRDPSDWDAFQGVQVVNVLA